MAFSDGMRERSQVLKSFLSRGYLEDRLSCRTFDFDFQQDIVVDVRNGNTDGGIHRRAHALLRRYLSSHQNAVVILDKNFGHSYKSGDAGVTNTETDMASLETYISSAFSEAVSGQYNDPWGVGAQVMNNDMFNMFLAEKILKQFKPELLVVNMQDVDVCHTNFTAYCDNLRKADYALAHLWNTIQSTPGLANNTVLIAAPEHGRNSTPNTVMDAFGRYAVDHTNDAMAREIFCLVLGPAGVVKQNQVISSVAGESIDIVPTIADVLGFLPAIPSGYLNGSPLAQAFV